MEHLPSDHHYLRQSDHGGSGEPLHGITADVSRSDDPSQLQPAADNPQPNAGEAVPTARDTPPGGAVESTQPYDISTETSPATADSAEPAPPSEPRIKLSVQVQRAIGSVVSPTTYRERHPGGPDVKLHVHVGRHAIPSDFRDAAKLIADPATRPDIHTYEETAGRHQLPVLNQIAAMPEGTDASKIVLARGRPDGTKELVSLDKAFLNHEVIQTLPGSGVKVGHFDLTGTGSDAVLKDKQDSITYEVGSQLDDMLDSMASQLGKFADVQTERDALMLGPAVHEDGSVTAGRFEQEADRIIAESPDLQQKPIVSVLDRHGSLHSWLFHRARAAGVPVERSFAGRQTRQTENGQTVQEPFVYGYQGQAIRMHTIGRVPDATLIRNCFLEHVLSQALPETNVQVSGQEYTRYARSVVESLGPDSAEEVYREHRRVRFDPESPQIAIETTLRRRGLPPLATTTEGIRAYNAAKAAAWEAKKAAVIADFKARQQQKHGSA
jgi:hypothetical protein